MISIGTEWTSRSTKIVSLTAAALIWFAGCSTGNHVLRDGDIAKRLGNDPANPGATESQPGGANEARISSEAVLRAEALLDSAQADLRAGRPRRALEQLLEAQTHDGWQESSRAGGLVFWTGHAYELVNEPFAAMAKFREVVRLYEGTPLAGRAARRLERLEREQLDQPSR